MISRKQVVLAGIGIISLVVVACGGGGSSSGGSTEATATPPPATSTPTPIQDGGAVPPADAVSTELGLLDTPSPAGVKVGTGIGRLAPNFRLENSEGGTIALSDLRGTPVLLNFWATWCGPCRFEMPELQALFGRMGDRLFILAVDLDESKGEVNNFKEELGLTFPTVLDDGQKVFDRYAPFGLPSTYLLDADGVIRGVKIGPFVSQDDIENSLEKIGLG